MPVLVATGRYGSNFDTSYSLIKGSRPLRNDIFEKRDATGSNRDIGVVAEAGAAIVDADHARQGQLTGGHKFKGESAVGIGLGFEDA